MAMIRYGLVLVLVCLAAMPLSAQPSFDCARAQAWDERAICADPALAALDRRIATAWGARDAGMPEAQLQAMLAEQRAFLRDRRACNTGQEKAEACLARRMTARAQALEAANRGAAAPAPVPQAAPQAAPAATGPTRQRACGNPGADPVGQALCGDRALRAQEADLVARTNRLAAQAATREALLASHAAYEAARDACVFESVAPEIARCLGEVIGDRLALLAR
jgi:uncharacterized protein